MRIKRTCLLIGICLMLAVPGYAPAENAAPLVISNPPVDRTLYPSPDVPESLPVDDSYFDDAVFMGDSILSGLEVYRMIPNAEYACEIGTSVHRALKERVILVGSKYYKLIDYAMLTNPSKIYIMLGTNGIDIVKTSRVLGDMREMMTYIIETWPDVLVYIISLPPVGPAATKKHRLLNNDNIVKYNEGLRQIAEEYQVYYLHTNPLFTQDDGSLNREFGAKDGYHMVREAHEIFRDYLYTHTVALVKSQN